MIRRFRSCFAILALAVLPALGACETAPGTGRTIFTGGMGPETEARLGYQEHQKIVPQFGGADADPAIDTYVTGIGNLLAKTSEIPDLKFTFTVLDTPMVNAFALPGGYIYIHSETLMRVGSVDELAGVLGHEIAHVQARHFSRRESETALPGLAARVIGMGAAIAAQEPGLAVAGEGVNVSLKIGFTREYEAEADRLGAIWVTRAGYDSVALTYFLDKIVQSTAGFPDYLPPYLATHPFPDDRIHAIEADAKTLHPKRVPNPELAAALPRVQARLAFLLKTGRANLSQGVAESSDPQIEAIMSQAEEIAARGDRDAALLLLGRIDWLEGADPRIPFQIGELLYASERYAEAASSYLRAIQLDTSRALVFFKLGKAFEASDQSHRAVYAFEQAILRTAEPSELRKRSEWEIYKLTFVPVEASGFANSSLSDAIDAASSAADTVSDATVTASDATDTVSDASNTASDTSGTASQIDAASHAIGPAAEAIDAATNKANAGAHESVAAEFSSEIARIAWWARLGSRFRQYANQFDVRWIEPSGKIALEKAAKKSSANTIGSALEFGRKRPATAGRWTLELVLEDDVVDRQTFVIRPQTDRALQPL